jgi:O-antigen/teichoic acid export membrane protein
MGLFGTDFQSGWLILAIVTAGELVNCATGSVGYLLLMSGNQNWIIRVRLLLAVLITLVNIALIPRWGVTAAAAVSAAGTILSNVAYLVIVRRTLSLFPYNRSYLKLLAPTLGAAALLWFLRGQVANFWPAPLTLVVTAALAALVLLGGFVAFGLTDDDRLIVDMVKRRIASFV